MIEAQLAKQWAAMPDFPNRISSWTWFKAAVSECLTLTAQRFQIRCELHSGHLADAFFDWAGYADGSQSFSKLDPVDYAHYACGVLLKSFIHAHPISLIDNQTSVVGANKSLMELLNWPDDMVLLCLTLTFLESWRMHLGAAPLAINLDLIKKHWDSFHENVREDTFSSVSFLDLFLGLEPVWANPMTAGNRPAMKLAYAKQHSSHS